MKRIVARYGLFSAMLVMAALCLPAPAFSARPIEFNMQVAQTKVGEGQITWSTGQRGLASLGDKVYATWVSAIPGISSHAVWFSMSEDGGKTWGPMKKISDTTGSGSSVTVSSDGAVHVVWDGASNILYSKSVNDGSSWSTPVNVSGAYSADYASSVAVDANGKLYAAWHAGSYANTYIYVSSSTDGVNWDIYQITGSFKGTDPSIGVDANGNVHAAWYTYISSTEKYIYFSKSLNGGLSWTSPVAVNGTATATWDTSLAVSGAGAVYVAWSYYGEGVYCAYSTDGANWSQELVSPTSASSNMGTSVAVSPDGSVNIAWEGDPEVQFARGSNVCSNWSGIVNVDASGDYPHVAVDGAGKALVMWTGDAPIAVFFTREQ